MQKLQHAGNPCFYIVTPVYNAANYIDETIASVVTQSGNFTVHYHVQDGGSTDGTVEKVAAWEALLREKPPWLACNRVTFTWASATDNGMYDAINKGFEHQMVPSDGIMAWVNADDAYLQYAFSMAAAAFSDLPQMDWFGGTVAVLFESGAFGTIYDAPFPREVIREYCCDGRLWRHVQQNGLFWRARLWEKAGPLDATLRYAGDYALWPKFAEHTALYHSSEVIGIFRLREGQLSKNKGYNEETEKVCPQDKREEALRRFLCGQAGTPKAPFLMIDGAGRFFLTEKVTFPLGGNARSGWRAFIRAFFSGKNGMV